MYLLLVVGIILGLSYIPSQPGAHFSPSSSIILVAFLTLIYAYLGIAVIRVFLARPRDSGPHPAYMARLPLLDARRLTGRLLRFLLFYRGLLLGLYAFEIYGLKWSYLVNEYWGLKNWVLLDEILILSPFLLKMMISFVASFPVDRLLRGSAWGLKEYISFQVRTVLLVVLLPLLILLSVYDLLSIIASSPGSQSIAAPLAWVVIPFVVICIYLFAPLALKSLWRAKALPEGPLRVRLEETARRVNFGYAGLLIWPTFGGHILTACVAGLLSRFRYVLFTDDLLASLSPEEVEAVLAHEMGHIKKHHFRFYLLFAGVFIILLLLLDVFLSFLTDFLSMGNKITEAVALAVLGVAFLFYWGLLFGYISRRLERQADLYGANVAGSAALVSALEKLAFFSGRTTRHFSWRHFSIGQRIDFLNRAQEDPEVEHKFLRHLRRLILGILLSFFIGLFIIILLVLFVW
ncbi:MAG: hypothetical protein AMS15_01135 [Planctomycetes bacterium DG_23]|nr:MAG: hypothetical protein AMS15_01135 [Planctomycetes bacterium DG_23]